MPPLKVYEYRPNMLHPDYYCHVDNRAKQQDALLRASATENGFGVVVSCRRGVFTVAGIVVPIRVALDTRVSIWLSYGLMRGKVQSKSIESERKGADGGTVSVAFDCANRHHWCEQPR